MHPCHLLPPPTAFDLDSQEIDIPSQLDNVTFIIFHQNPPTSPSSRVLLHSFSFDRKAAHRTGTCATIFLTHTLSFEEEKSNYYVSFPRVPFSAPNLH